MKEYNGEINTEDIEKNHTFGIQFTSTDDIHVIVYKNKKCYEICNHVGNISGDKFDQSEKSVIFEDFKQLIRIALNSCEVNSVERGSTEMFDVRINMAN